MDSTPEKVAAALLKRIGLQDVLPCPLDKILDYMDYSCFTFAPTQETLDLAGAVYYSEKRIFVNHSDSRQRQRFTVAHEIGHILLHGDANYVDFRNSATADPIKEKEADEFAAHLLMPTNRFKEMWQDFSGNIDKIANYFDVSLRAVHLRACNLKL